MRRGMAGSRNGSLMTLVWCGVVPAATPQTACGRERARLPDCSTACGCHERPSLLAGHRTSNLSTERPPLAWVPSHRLIKVRSSFGPRSQSSGCAACLSVQLHLTTTFISKTVFHPPRYTMSTRKRKQDEEELVALPSDESEEEEE
jgi:hypothetical protein